MFLFDIDGTLLSSGRAGQRAMEEALQLEFGLPELAYEIATAGRTDRAIISDLFAWHAVELTEPQFARFRDRYFSLLPKHLQHGGGQILPGVCELLEALSAATSQTFGLLTGNFEHSGWMKVRHFQIDHHFSFGAFGDAHTNRDDVARIAWGLVQQRASVTAEQVWVIGDTPADVQCARAIGARVLAVATGKYSIAELQAALPDALLSDFSQTDQVLEILLAPAGNALPEIASTR